MINYILLVLLILVFSSRKGINITITHKHEQPKQPKEQKYNQSMIDLLPPNVKEYYHKNNGQNRF